MAATYQISQDDPIAAKLLELIPIKANELGWFTEDSSLSEYVVMLFSSPKSQDDIARELTDELLQPEDRGAPDFAQWLFTTIAELRGESTGGQAAMAITSDNIGESVVAGSGDVDMEGAPMDNVPTGPKSMRNGSRSRRNVLGQISKHMDRSGDSALHKVRNTKGNERINSHSREPPKGPRNLQQQNRGPRQNNGRSAGPMGMPQMPGMPGMNMNMSPQQQMQMLQLYEQQARMMAEILGPQQQFSGQPPMMPGGPFPNGMGQQNAGGRSLFDRVEQPQRNGHRQGHKGQWSQNTSHQNNDSMTDTPAAGEPTSSMEVESSQPKPAAETPCKFNLSCKNKDCPFAHQSPAAPPGVPIDVSDKCSYGAACKNKKCVANHPSPAQKLGSYADMDCKYFPNCTNPTCPFKHPEMPFCRNGADCQTEGCKFTHLKIKCKFNPCKNRQCPYKHDEGQRGVFSDKVWVAEDYNKQDHLSDRKFVEDSGQEEELIIPGSGSTVAESTAGMEVVS